ncbi:MAG: endonuclease/exonuclease/phosphatase family protein [Candidatus Pacebacteria bacterium]|nr:endonuclease/exonuclease/phosphatase family protein [Candidatus Paceibacterota bacterium]
MKVISLNTWGGEAGVKSLLDFFAAHKDVDIFCLQEVWNGGEEMLDKNTGGSWLNRRVPTLLSDISAILSEYKVFYRPHFHDFFGLALFIKRDIKVTEEGDLYIYKEQGYISPEEFGDHARILQYVTIEIENKLHTLIQLHGLWNGKGKGDCDERLEQSDRIAGFVSKLPNPTVLVGDFNLRPDTDSLKRIEKIGLRNLINEYGIVSTRTSHYTKSEKFADYAFVSEGIEVLDFTVLPDEVSDHAPLYLEYSLS